MKPTYEWPRAKIYHIDKAVKSKRQTYAFHRDALPQLVFWLVMGIVIWSLIIRYTPL